MASPALIEASTFVGKKILSFKYTIKDVTTTFKFGILRSPPFSVLLRESTSPQGSWDSIWHLRIGKDILSLCQGWNKSGKLADRSENSDDDDDGIFSDSVLADLWF